LKGLGLKGLEMPTGRLLILDFFIVETVRVKRRIVQTRKQKGGTESKRARQ